MSMIRSACRAGGSYCFVFGVYIMCGFFVNGSSAVDRKSLTFFENGCTIVLGSHLLDIPCVAGPGREAGRLGCNETMQGVSRRRSVGQRREAAIRELRGNGNRPRPGSCLKLCLTFGRRFCLMAPRRSDNGTGADDGGGSMCSTTEQKPSNLCSRIDGSKTSGLDARFVLLIIPAAGSESTGTIRTRTLNRQLFDTFTHKENLP